MKKVKVRIQPFFLPSMLLIEIDRKLGLCVEVSLFALPEPVEPFPSLRDFPEFWVGVRYVFNRGPGGDLIFAFPGTCFLYSKYSR